MYRMIPGRTQPVDYDMPDPVEAHVDAPANRGKISWWKVSAWTLVFLSGAVADSALYWIWRALNAAVGGL